MIDDPKAIGKRLKNLRLALGFPTQVAFANELGIERNTYNPFEKGTRELGLDDNDDEMAYDDGPCDCPECEGATARMWSKNGKLPLSIRIALNLASPQPVTGVSTHA